MKVTLKLNDVLVSNNLINDELMKIPLRANVSFRIAKLAKALAQNVELIQKQIQGIIEPHQVDDGKGGKTIPKESIAGIDAEINSFLFQEKVEIDFQPIKYSEFAKSKGPITDDTEWYEVKPSVLQGLFWAIQDDVNMIHHD